jgi:cation transport regulator ChaC
MSVVTPKADIFSINHDHEGYAGSLPPGLAAGHLAIAGGYLGASAEYLKNVVADLDELSIRDATRLDAHRRVTVFTRRPI